LRVIVGCKANKPRVTLANLANTACCGWDLDDWTVLSGTGFASDREARTIIACCDVHALGDRHAQTLTRCCKMFGCNIELADKFRFDLADYLATAIGNLFYQLRYIQGTVIGDRCRSHQQLNRGSLK